MVFPATTVAANTVKFTFLRVIPLLLLRLCRVAPSLVWLHLLPVLVAQLILILGVGMLLSALIPFVPGLRFAIVR